MGNVTLTTLALVLTAQTLPVLNCSGSDSQVLADTSQSYLLLACQPYKFEDSRPILYAGQLSPSS